MLPDSRISTNAIVADYLPPDDDLRLDNKLVDRERGGIALSDPTQGLNGWIWRLEYDELVGGIRLTNEGTAATSIVVADVTPTEVALAFDQNMRPAICYVVDGATYLQWFDSVAETQVTQSFIGARSPMLCLDDKRLVSVLTSDIIFAYIRSGALYYRMQRDRFSVERFAGTLPAGADQLDLLGIGITKQNRLQFKIRAVV